ncbi:MAG: thioredoxin fold domain-containing protein [Gammaproteobacteria bacterium]|nr:thioredoxin fold domain-containing protein [Gammaproteobacteria bacterium]MYF29009.1 thioredoxin fold domain-containing protein [Gammaproteobacteria bacterium]MYK48031.1 thioredoxin fold domain-containing protein [Gammaproteobacteria bacterium]
MPQAVRSTAPRCAGRVADANCWAHSTQRAPSYSQQRERGGLYLHVFTDVDCPHCRAFHADVTALNCLGIEVRYLAFARGGPESATAARMASAWCAGDPGAALAALKRDETIAAASCDDPVAAQFELGRQVGVEGTPTSVTDSGRLIHGHLAPSEMAVRLGLEPLGETH